MSQRSLGMVALMAGACLLLSACGDSRSSSEKGPELFTVQRVIDGHTIEVEGQGEELTIWLLSTDTPETKDPNEFLECLGPEATENLESLLNEGDQVRLEYVGDRKDPDGRTSAVVYEDDVLINAEMVRAGLGVPMVIDPERGPYDELKTAFEEAADAEVGFFDPSIDCTIPAQAEAAQTPEDAQEVLDTIEDAARSRAWVGELRDHRGISPYISELRSLSEETS